MKKIAIIAEGGGMRNAVVAGFMVGSGLDAVHVNAYYGASSSIGNALFLATGQMEEAFDLWVNKMTAPEAFDYKKPIKKQYPADIRFVADNVCATLDEKKLEKSEMDIIASVVEKGTYNLEYLKLDVQDYRELFMATCSIPFIVESVEYRGKTYLDGGVSDNFPLMKAYRDGYRKFIILNNQPKIRLYKSRVTERLLEKTPSKGLKAAWEKDVKNYLDAWDFIANPPSDVEIFHFVPEKKDVVFMFERDPEVVKVGFEKGERLGHIRKNELQDFITS